MITLYCLTSGQRARRALCHVWLLVSAVGCDAVLGLDQLSIQAKSSDAGVARQCQKHRDCNHDDNTPSICREPTGTCVALKSPDCPTVSGDYLNDGAIVIGSMFSLTGPQASTNAARENSAILALEQVNAQGGVPKGTTSANARPLVLVSCDASANLQRAGVHLVEELGVPAIVGPNQSQDVLDLSRDISVPGGTLVVSPTALASSIADLLDDGLTWQMVPTDVQRGPLMILELEAMQKQLRSERDLDKVKLLIVFRNDALGIGSRNSLNDLVINGLPLTDPSNYGSSVLIDAYDVSAPNHHADVQAAADFAPDIIVLSGTAEMVTDVMVPLERAWKSGKPRPMYLVIDGIKTTELVQAVTDNDDLRKRIRGTGVIPSPRSTRVFDAFRLSYQVRYGAEANVSGTGPTYDATFAIALALAATQDQPVSGRSIANGLYMLAGGTTEIELRETNVLAAFSRLVMHQPLSAIGTFGPLAWAQNGAVLGGTLELWCVGKDQSQLSFESSGLTLDLATGVLQGDYKQCP